MRKKTGEPGAITVFLCIVLASIVAVMGVLIDSARIRVADAQLRRATQLALDSAMASYSKSLREDYGLFGLSPKVEANDVFSQYFTANLTPNASKDKTTTDQLIDLFGDAFGLTDSVTYTDPIRIQPGGARKAAAGILAGLDLPQGTHNALSGMDYGAVGMLPLTNTAVLYNQIVEFSKYRVPVNMIQSGFAEDLMAFLGESEQVEKDMKATQVMLDASESIQKVFEQEKIVRDHIQAAIDAKERFNQGVDEWNELVLGGKEVEIRLNETVQLDNFDSKQVIEFAQGAIIAPADMFHKEDWYVAGAYLNVPTYTLEGYLNWYTENIDDAVTIHINKVIDYYNNVILTMQTPHEDYIEAWNDSLDELGDYIEDTFTTNARKQGDVMRGLIADAYLAETRGVTIGHAYMLNEAREVLGAALKVATESLDELEARIESARAELEEANENEALDHCSDSVRDEWSGSEGDYKKYNEMLNKCALNVADSQLQMDQATENCNQEPNPDGAADRYENIVRAGTTEFDGSHYRLVPLGEDAISEFDMSYDDSEEAGKKADAESKKVKELAAKKPPSDDDAKNRFKGKDEPMPERYKGDLGEDEDKKDDSAAEIDKLKKKKKKDVDDDVSSATGPMAGLLEPLAGGAGAVLGSVYVSDYVLSMYGNAAPEHEEKDQSYQQDRQYKRVTSLRGAIVPVQPGEVLEDEHNEPLDSRVGFFKNAEVEYLLYGKSVETSNVNSAKLPLTAVCVGFNILQVRNNKTLKAAVEAASTALMAFTGVPSTVFRIGFYLILAAAETAFDMYYLMRGYKLPIMSRDGDKLLMLPTTNANDVINAKSPEVSISYEFYLRLQLLVKLTGGNARADILSRMANLMECNIRYRAEHDGSYQSDADFDITKSYTSIAAMGGGSIPYWFMNAPIMGEARQTSRLRPLAPAIFVESY